jgi:3',5'-cyclic AMP phosphodiesterase CpdA
MRAMKKFRSHSIIVTWDLMSFCSDLLAPYRVLRFLSILGFPLLIFVLSPSMSTKKIWKSSGDIPVAERAPPFDPAQDPIVIAHFTDLHISPVLPDVLSLVRDSFAFVGRHVHPAAYVLTGDLTDDLSFGPTGPACLPSEPDWQLYNETIRNAPIDHSKVVEILGNHDVWMRATFDDRYSSCLLHPIVNWVSQSFNFGQIRVVTFVPVKLPTTSGLYGYFATLTPAILAELEAQLGQPTNAQWTIVASHWTSLTLHKFRTVRSSSSGRTFTEILSEYAVAFLNGHEHPPGEFEAVHTGDFIELTGNAFRLKDGFNLLALDNGRISYVTMISNHSKNAIVTSPGRNSLATRIFADQDFQIRVLSL